MSNAFGVAGHSEDICEFGLVASEQIAACSCISATTAVQHNSQDFGSLVPRISGPESSAYSQLPRL